MWTLTVNALNIDNRQEILTNILTFREISRREMAEISAVANDILNNDES